MKKTIVLAIALISVITLAGCTLFFGEDGEPGSAYIAYSWVSVPNYLFTSDPSLPQTIYNGTYYEAIPGTYSFSYEAWDGSFWQDTYTTYVNPGEPGFLFTDGADGEDIYFELTLYSIGPSFWEWPYPMSNQRKMEREQEEIGRANLASQFRQSNSMGKRTVDLQ